MQSHVGIEQRFRCSGGMYLLAFHNVTSFSVSCLLFVGLAWVSFSLSLSLSGWRLLIVVVVLSKQARFEQFSFGARLFHGDILRLLHLLSAMLLLFGAPLCDAVRRFVQDERTD